MLAVIVLRQMGMKVTLAIAAFILTVGVVRANATDSSCIASLNEAGAAGWMRGKVGVVRHHLFPIDGYRGAFWAWPAFSRRYVDFHDRRPELFDKELMAQRLERRDFPEPVCTAAELRAFLDGARRRGEAVTINIGISPEGRLNPMSVELLRSLL